MQVVPVPGALPGSCFKCGSASRAEYIDLDFSMEFHGAVYLCNLCVTEMGTLIGLLSPRKKAELEEALSATLTQLYEVKRELDGMRMVVDGFTLAHGASNFTVLPPNLLPGDIHVEAPTGGAEGEGGFDSESPSGTEGLGTGAGETVESSDDSGVAVLSNDDSKPEFQLGF